MSGTDRVRGGPWTPRSQNVVSENSPELNPEPSPADQSNRPSSFLQRAEDNSEVLPRAPQWQARRRQRVSPYSDQVDEGQVQIPRRRAPPPLARQDEELDDASRIIGTPDLVTRSLLGLGIQKRDFAVADVEPSRGIHSPSIMGTSEVRSGVPVTTPKIHTPPAANRFSQSVEVEDIRDLKEAGPARRQLRRVGQLSQYPAKGRGLAQQSGSRPPTRRDTDRYCDRGQERAVPVRQSLLSWDSGRGEEEEEEGDSDNAAVEAEHVTESAESELARIYRDCVGEYDHIFDDIDIGGEEDVGEVPQIPRKSSRRLLQTSQQRNDRLQLQASTSPSAFRESPRPLMLKSPVTLPVTLPQTPYRHLGVQQRASSNAPTQSARPLPATPQRGFVASQAAFFNSINRDEGGTPSDLHPHLRPRPLEIKKSPVNSKAPKTRPPPLPKLEPKN